MKIYPLSIFLLACLIINVQPGYSQNETDQYQSFEITGVSFNIIGTSNVRDWEIESSVMRGTVRLNPEFFTEGVEDPEDADRWFDEISLQIPNESLDSGISAMNSAMNDNLESDEHPELKYRMISVDAMWESGRSTYTLLMDGVFTAAGNDHNFSHEVDIRLQDDGSLLVTGELDMKITDFDIEPPTFMRGALVTTDEISVEFSFSLIGQD